MDFQLIIAWNTAKTLRDSDFEVRQDWSLKFSLKKKKTALVNLRPIKV